MNNKNLFVVYLRLKLFDQMISKMYEPIGFPCDKGCRFQSVRTEIKTST